MRPAFFYERRRPGGSARGAILSAAK